MEDEDICIDVPGRAGLGDALSSPTAEVCRLLKVGRLDDDQLSTRTSSAQLRALMCMTPEPGLYQQSMRMAYSRFFSFSGDRSSWLSWLTRFLLQACLVRISEQSQPIGTPLISLAFKWPSFCFKGVYRSPSHVCLWALGALGETSIASEA